MSWFAVSKRGKAVFHAYFMKHNVTLYNAKGQLRGDMTMDDALKTYIFEGYVGSGLKYPADLEPHEVITEAE